MAVVGAAPLPNASRRAESRPVSPGRTGPPEICTRPTPETTLASGRSGQVVRAPGSKRHQRRRQPRR